MQILLTPNASYAILVVGLFMMFMTVITMFRRGRRLESKALHFLELALDGRADEARIQARTESRELSVVLGALGGELASPGQRSLLRDLPPLVLICAPPLLFAVHAFYGISSSAAPEKIQMVRALLIGTALFLPAIFASFIAIIESSRSAARGIRGTCIKLLARSVKHSIETDLSEALRRGKVRDPRGE